MNYKYTYEMPIGPLVICEEEDKITEIYLTNSDNNKEIEEKETPLIKLVKEQLIDYFNGERKKFDFPINMKGTEFQVKVWEALMTIPFGETCSYKEIATKIGNPKASRAVGMANNKNPLLIVVPCHRVIGTNGSLVGYACGLHVKENLLRLEGRI